MLLLLDVNSREELFSGIKSSILKKKLQDLKLEFELLNKIMRGNFKAVGSWSEIYRSLKDSFPMFVDENDERSEEIKERLGMRRMKSLYEEYCDFLAGNKVSLSETLTELLGSEEGKLLLQKLYYSIEERLTLVNEFVAISAGNKPVRLSGEAFSLAEKIYSGLDAIEPIVARLDELIHTSSDIISGEDRVFYIPVYSFKNYNSVERLNSKINRAYSESVSFNAVLKDKSVDDVLKALNKYWNDCKTIQALAQSTTEEEAREVGFNLRDYSDKNDFLDLSLLKADFLDLSLLKADLFELLNKNDVFPGNLEGDGVLRESVD
jgi:hypothetical protein